MAKDSLDHHALGSVVPGGWEPKGTSSYELDAVMKDGHLLFQYAHAFVEQSKGLEPLSENAALQFGPKTPLLDIKLDGDCTVEFRLSNSIKWNWPVDYDGITTTRNHKNRYFKLLYIAQDGRQFEREDFPTNEACRRIIFGAKHNKDDPSDRQHGFNINLELVYPNGDVLPITVDPDIRNPGTYPLTDDPS